MNTRPVNFSSGPSILPAEVLAQAAEDVRRHRELQLSILEISHRGGFWVARIEAIEAKLRQLMGISDDYAALFLQGGATTQFSHVPLNLAAEGQPVDYVLTGRWAKKAADEATLLGRPANIAGSSEDTSYDRIPDPIVPSPDAAYLHYTTNNTVCGTEYPEPPAVEADVVLVADASSNILSKSIDVGRHGLIYAGAQKNLGPAGVTLVIVRRDLLLRPTWILPTLTRYKTHADKGSMHNTPPVFAIHVVGLVLDWIEREGGVEEMERRNKAKADLLYETIDTSDFFSARAVRGSRSRMNVCFATPSADLDDKFAADAETEGLLFLKGHRSVGGLRAALYNAMSLDGVETLVGFMREFERRA